MKFQFTCKQCGKEIEVVLKIIIGTYTIDLPKDLERASIALKCPGCGKTSVVSIRPSPALDRLMQLKLKSARNPPMN